MKKIVFGLVLIFGLFANTQAQKFAFVDVKYVLSQLDEYKTAQNQLDILSEKYQNEIEAKFKEIDDRNKTYQQEKILLPEDARQKEEQALVELGGAARSLQQKYFGINGELFQKRKSLIEPIQVKIDKAIKELAKEKDYDFVLEKGNNANILFVNPKYDKSESVLKKN